MKPSQCILVLSHRCNYTCKHCYDRMNRDILPHDIVVKNAFKVLKRLKKEKITHITFSGGECSLFPYFLDILKFAKKKGFFINIFTNGSSKNFALFDFADSISTSIDGRKNIHNLIRGSSLAYDNVLNFISNPIIKNKKLTVQSTINRMNIGDLSFLDEILQKLIFPKDLLYVSCMLETSDPSQRGLTLTQKEEKKVFMYLQELLKKNNYHINLKTNLIEVESLKLLSPTHMDFQIPLFIDLASDKYYFSSNSSQFFSDVLNLDFSMFEKELFGIHKKLLSLKLKKGTYLNLENYFLS